MSNCLISSATAKHSSWILAVSRRSLSNSSEIVFIVVKVK
nr:MAG TPA: hypothetical protein [Crassvirales sp.]